MTDDTNPETTPEVSAPEVEAPAVQAAAEQQAVVAAVEDQLAESLGRTRKSLLWTGIGLAILGVVALLFPVMSSLVTSAMIGWVLIFAGAFGLFGSFSFQGAGPFFGAFLTSLLTIALGVFMLRNPGIALGVLTIFIAVVFLVDGAYTTGAAFDLKPIEGWGWLLFSAVISILAGILIIAGLPGTSLVILGIMVGIRLLSSGISSIMLSRVLPKEE